MADGGVSRLKNIVKVPDLRGKILFTILVIGLYRLGSHLPAPFVDYNAIQAGRSSSASGVIGFLDLFSGGALTNVSVFFLGIMPYITASIIMQLLGVVIPKLEQWQNEGPAGQKKVTQWTRYVTVALAVVQSTGFVFALNSGNASAFQLDNNQLAGGTKYILGDFNAWKALLIVLTWTAGTAIVMWFGELITQRGIGNGMSILIFASVISRLPYQMAAVRADGGNLKFLAILLLLVGMIVAIVIVESGQRRIPVQFAKRVVGRRMYGGQNTYIPLKVNQSGVIPVIFASSILQFPVLLANVVPWQGFKNFVVEELAGTSETTWTYIIIYSLMILFFSYFYTAIAFNPEQQADVIRKQGGFIPGIRPGPPTSAYLAKVLNRITFPGAMFLMIVALIPFLVIKAWNIPLQFGGTTLLITVGVALETMRQIDSQLMMRNYEGFLR